LSDFISDFMTAAGHCYQKLNFNFLFSALLWCMLWSSWFGVSEVYAQSAGDDDSIEYKLKAGFIYNFAKFTEWMPETFKDSSLMNLCVSADKIAAETPDPVFSNISSVLNEKSVGDKKIVVKKCENKDEIKSCHILFIVSEHTEFIQEKLDNTKGLSILTVGEAENFSRMGGMINFFKENKGINILNPKALLRFEVNVNAAERAKLKFRSSLLMSAKIFREEVK